MSPIRAADPGAVRGQEQQAHRGPGRRDLDHPHTGRHHGVEAQLTPQHLGVEGQGVVLVGNRKGHAENSRRLHAGQTAVGAGTERGRTRARACFLERLGTVACVAIKLENVGIAVRDIEAAIDFFTTWG